MGRFQQFLDASKYEEFVKETFDALVDKNVGVVHLHKCFQGKRTGHNHDIDVAIEVTIAELKIQILVECKHYKNSVEISDVLEFAQRIDDIGAHKGVIVSTVGFQEGALKVARAHGIALILTRPVWRHVLYSRSGDDIHGFTVREMYIGGDSDSDFLIGVTVEAVNYSINLYPQFGDAWKEIVDFLVADSDKVLGEEFRRRSMKQQFSVVCPFCGEQLRTPIARQCRYCGMDWHDLDNIYCGKRV